MHDAAGNMVGGSANGGPGTSTQYVYFRGGLLAQYWNGQGLWFAHLNGLGSTQQFTDYTGGNKRATMFYPFGQPGPSGSGSGSYLQALWSGFEDGDFWATSEWQTDTRRYTPGLGRWYTPDPAGKGAVHLDDPQTWNMYAYVRDNPTTLTDPSGLDSFWTRLEHEVAGYVSTALLQGARQLTAENPFPPRKPPNAPPMAELKTDMGGHTTTFYTIDGNGNLTTVQIETRTDVVRGAKPGAGDPYTTHNIVGVSDRHAGERSYGPKGAFIDTGDPRGRDIHGGGRGLDDPFALRQGWWPTTGCTRGQNEDVMDLGNSITNFQQANPDVPIPYTRE